MYFDATHARRELARTFASVSYDPAPDDWRTLRLGIERDLQAKRLRPNVPVPARRNPLAYLRTMHRETGSVTEALLALTRPGSWTSSGGSFRLAEMIGTDLSALCDEALARNGQLRFLEIGAGWAGLRTPPQEGAPRDVASLARRFADSLGDGVELHFTNLTPWHEDLPAGVVEHPYVTAAALRALEHQGVPAASLDVIYSQAAAYFETNHRAFLEAAAHLLRPGGTLIFNHRTELTEDMDDLAGKLGLELSCRHVAGGMNGSVARFDRPREKWRPVAVGQEKVLLENLAE